MCDVQFLVSLLIIIDVVMILVAIDVVPSVVVFIVIVIFVVIIVTSMVIIIAVIVVIVVIVVVAWSMTKSLHVSFLLKEECHNALCATTSGVCVCCDWELWRVTQATLNVFCYC